jgi:hypothetical protein
MNITLKKVLHLSVLLVWIVMMGLLVERTYLRPPTVIALDEAAEQGVRTGDEWSGIYQQGRKIGYAHSRILRDGEAYHLLEESVLDLLVLNNVQRVRTVINSYTTKNFQLKYFDFSLQSPMSAMTIKGAVVGKQLILDITSGGQTRNERIALEQPPYLSPNIKPALVLLGLETGKKYSFPLFNPATMNMDRATVSVESRERIKIGDAEKTVYKLKEEFQGLQAFAWMTEDGDILKEESPLGYVLVKETMTEARRIDKKGPAVDILEMVMIPSKRIENAAATRTFKARLSGVSLDGFDLEGHRQRFSGNVVEITVPEPAESYELPYPLTDQAAALGSTALIQSDDPRIRKQAASILGKTALAREAAAKLTGWTYTALDKKPVVSIPSALEVLEQRVGDCNEHTVLYTALARAAGIPTRMAAGIVYLRDGFYYHAWPEVWLGDGWTAVDPTFNQFPADATHIRFIAGNIDRQTEILKLLGKLKVEVLEYN